METYPPEQIPYPPPEQIPYPPPEQIPYPPPEQIPYPPPETPYPETPYPETPAVTGPTYVTTLEELVSTQGAIIQKEAGDKMSLLRMFQPEASTLKLSLVTWASLGFPANWVVNTVQASPPLVCSDSQTRRFYEYVLYLIGTPIQPLLDELSSRVPGVTFNFFLKDVNTIGLSVIKA